MPKYMASWNVEISYGHVVNLKLKAFAETTGNEAYEPLISFKGLDAS